GAGYVQLPQVDAGARMQAKPGDDRNDLRPFFGMLEDDERLARDPAAQLRACVVGRGRQLLEPLCMPMLAYEPKGVLPRRHNDGRGHAVTPKLAVVDLGPPD